MDAENWIREHVEPTGEIEFVQDAPWSTILRVPVGADVAWFKHCKAVWRFEPRLTAALCERWPDRVPEVIAHDGDRAWLLTWDAGRHIHEVANEHELWLDAMRLYAELQRGEVVHSDAHVTAGVPDLRLATLPARYAHMLEQDLPISAEEHERLRRFEPRFAELCADLASRGVPETIQHDDLHMFNVYVRDGRPRILDWGDSSVAHPYFSLVANLRHVDAVAHPAIKRAFLDAWDGDEKALALALRVGRIAHSFAWFRQREPLPPEMLALDDDFPRVVAMAVAQTDE